MGKTSEIAASMNNIDIELAKKSNEIEVKLTEKTAEAKPFKMSDYLKPKLITEEDIEKEAKESNKKHVDADDKMIAGAAVGGSGAALAKHTYDRGNITGRETLYHNTRKENVDSIKKNGLKGSKALDPNLAFTPDTLKHVSKDKLANKVYFGRKKSVAESVGAAAKIKDKENGKGDHIRETMKAKVPTWKMKEVDNPELLGAKNEKEYTNKFIEANRNKLKTEAKLSDKDIDMLKNSPESMELGKDVFKDFGRKGTAVIEGDVDGKYFKGHKGYQKATLKEVGEFIKNNPKRFAKGVAQAGAGAALIGAGGKIVYDAYKEKKAQKIANIILEEAGLEKIAKPVKDSRVDMIAAIIMSEAGFEK